MKKLIFIFFLSAGLVSLKANAQSTTTPETKTSFSIADSAAFKGKYKFEGLPFEYIEVTVQDNKLYFVGGEYNGFLTPIIDKKDAFDVNGEAVFTFGRNAENNIIELKVDYQGQSYVGKKEEKKNN
jgi:hypothetical protein